jgi:uncharacterized protein DUF6011
MLKIFNGRYTIRNRRSGEHRTFELKTQAEDSKFAPGKRVVALLTGPDNTSDYTGFGFVEDFGIQVWKSKRGENGQKSMHEQYADLLWSLALDGAFSRYAETYEFLMEGTCAVCNRVLTEPLSLTTGIGPVCREKVGAVA